MTTIKRALRAALTRLERALDRKEDRLAAERYFAATGYNLPVDERAAWLRGAAEGAPKIKHHVHSVL